MQHNPAEIPFSREDLDVLKTILAATKVDSIVPAVITYLKAVTSMPLMARVFFESDIVAQLTATFVQLTDIAKNRPLNKTNQVIGILDIFADLAKQRPFLSLALITSRAASLPRGIRRGRRDFPRDQHVQHQPDGHQFGAGHPEGPHPIARDLPVFLHLQLLARAAVLLHLLHPGRKLHLQGAEVHHRARSGR